MAKTAAVALLSIIVLVGISINDSFSAKDDLPNGQPFNQLDERLTEIEESQTNVDSFFDVFYENYSVDSFFDIFVDLQTNVDSFFDVFFDVETPRDNCGEGEERVYNPDLKQWECGPENQVDSFFDVFYDITVTSDRHTQEISDINQRLIPLDQRCERPLVMVGIDSQGNIICEEIGLPPGPFCGDGIVNEPSEQCDDGNNIDGDGCSAICEIEDLPPPPSPSGLVINEIDYDQPGEDIVEFIEIYNPSLEPVFLGGHSLSLINGRGCDTYLIVDLGPGVEVEPFGYLVIGQEIVLDSIPPGTPFLPLPGPSSNVQNGPDLVRLYFLDSLLDEVQYEGEEPLCGFSEGLPSNPALEFDRDLSIGRIPNGEDTDNNSVDFSTIVPSPGIRNTS